MRQLVVGLKVWHLCKLAGSSEEGGIKSCEQGLKKF